jgi:hypothetical protein
MGARLDRCTARITSLSMRPLSWLIAAALVHLLIALLVLFLGGRREASHDRTTAMSDARDAAKPDTEIDIAFTPMPPSEERVVTPTADGKLTNLPGAIANTRAPSSGTTAVVASLIDEGAPPDNAPSPSSNGEAAARPGSPTTTPEASPQLSLAQLGIGAAGSNPFFRPGALPDKPSDPKDNTAGGALKAGLLERDLALGLGPEGPVLDALRDATSMSASPERGYAMFAVSIDENGFVKDIRLGDRTGGTGWDDAMNGALKALKGKKLALRGAVKGAKGVELKIEIKSDVVLPSGNRPDQRIKTPMTRSQVSRSENVPAGGTPGVVETRTIATFDVTDIGAKPRRVVHAHLVSATLL